MSNGQEDDEIIKLPLKERLECQKIQTEIARSEEEKKKIELERKELERKSKLHWWRKPLFLQAIIAGIIAAPVLWFYVKDVALPLSSRENIKLSREIEERNQELNEERKKIDEMKLKTERVLDVARREYEKVIAQKNLLEKRTKTLKLDNAIIVMQIKELKEEYTKKMKELKEEVKSMSSFTDWYDKAVGAYANQRNEEAISSFTTALSKKAGDASRAYALNYRGLIYLKTGKDEEALADFDESARLKPDNPRPYHNMTLIYILRKEYKRAFEKYEEAIRLYDIDGEDNTAYVFSKAINDLFKPVEGVEEIKASIKKKTYELGQKLLGP